MPDQNPDFVDELRFRIANPGAYLRRIRTTATNPGETAGRWAARAIAAGLEDGSLGVTICSALCRDVEQDRDRLVEMVEAAYRFADQLAQYRTPHAVSTLYAKQLRDALDRAGAAPVPGSSRRAQEPEPVRQDRRYRVEMAIRDRLFDAWPSIGSEDPVFLEQVAAEAAKSAMEAGMLGEPSPTDDDKTTSALRVVEALMAAKPGAAFAFEQAPGQRVLIVIGAFIKPAASETSPD